MFESDVWHRVGQDFVAHGARFFGKVAALDSVAFYVSSSGSIPNSPENLGTLSTIILLRELCQVLASVEGGGGAGKRNQQSG